MTTIPQLSVDAQALAKRLASAQPGQLFTWEELNQVLPGRSLSGKDRYVLNTAKRLVQRENKIVFASVHGEGIRRMTDEEIADLRHSTVRRVRNIARRDARKMTCADYEKLTNEKRISLNTGLAICGAIAQFTKAGSVKQVELQTAVSQKRLSFEETIKQFSAR